MKTALRKMGNSQGVILPKALIAQFGFDKEVEMRITETGILIEKPKAHPREGWAEASRAIAEAGDDALVWPEFGNEFDEEWEW